jgi:signal transduction histidine kinase
VSLQGDEDLRRELDELRTRTARRAAFVAGVAHDLRTPLASIIGSVQTLQQRGDQLSPELRDQLIGVIAKEADRLASLVSDVFDTVRIDTDSFSYRFAEVDVAELAGDAVAAATASGATGVVLEVAPELPFVRGDHDRLRQVLGNLIDNAVKFSPPDGAVEVGVRSADSRVLIEVRDHGDGIAPENHELIFEQLGRVPGATQPGTGLGLFISRAIAEAHGGTLDVTSTPGAGATFTLALPFA